MTDIIDIGTLPNDGTGDPLRVAFDKINNNFIELAQLAPTGPNGAFQYNANGYPEGTANFVYDITNNIINFGGNLVPVANSDVSIGSPDELSGNLFIADTGLNLGNVNFSENNQTVTLANAANLSQTANIHINNLIADGNLSIDGALNLSKFELDTLDFTTTNNAANQIVYESPMSNFDSGIFTITSREVGSNNSQSVTLSVTKRNDNGSISFTAYGTIFVGSPVTRYNADTGFGNVRIMVSPILNTTVVHHITYEIINP